MKKFTKIIVLIIMSAIMASGSFYAADKALAETEKQYRSGQIIAINEKNYLIANNKQFAEIIEITADNKLYQASEVHGLENIENLYAGQYLNKYFLIIATGRYLYRYDISDPRTPKIEFKRDLYVFRRGQFRNGSVNNLSGNKNFIFGAGSNGVRSFFPDNLFVNKIYTFDKSYGVAADDNKLAVITENKGAVYDILSGAKLAEVDLENEDKMTRSPVFDNSSNVYFPTDRGLVKVNVYDGFKKIYANPVPKQEIFSYGAAAATDGNIYYANGHGITVLDKNFNKTKFLNAAKGDRYGTNAWAVGIASAKLGAREVFVDFNKSSILLIDKNLKVLAQYKYKRLYPDFITTDLKIVPSVNLAAAGQKINLRMFGFWPNETVAIFFGKNSYTITVDNQGYGALELAVPYQDGRQTVIRAVGNDSGATYQTVFTVL